MIRIFTWVVNEIDLRFVWMWREYNWTTGPMLKRSSIEPKGQWFGKVDETGDR